LGARSGFDEEKTYKPDSTKLLYNVYLELSDMPSSEWAQIFDAERRFPRHSMWRRAWIEDKYIVIHCVPDELNKYHLRDLKEDANNANMKYRRYLREIAENRLKEIKKKEDEEQYLNNIKSDLDFD
jgi:hypothetical protein